MELSLQSHRQSPQSHLDQHLVMKKWNVTTFIWRGSHFFFAPALDLMPCLQARGMRDCNKGHSIKEIAQMVKQVLRKFFTKGPEFKSRLGRCLGATLLFQSHTHLYTCVLCNLVVLAGFWVPSFTWKTQKYFAPWRNYRGHPCPKLTYILPEILPLNLALFLHLA